MIVTKITFKDLTEEQTRQLTLMLIELNIPHDKDIFDTSETEWDEHTKGLYKAWKKAESAFRSRVFKIKNKIK